MHEPMIGRAGCVNRWRQGKGGKESKGRERRRTYETRINRRETQTGQKQTFTVKLSCCFHSCDSSFMSPDFNPLLPILRSGDNSCDLTSKEVRLTLKRNQNWSKWKWATRTTLHKNKGADWIHNYICVRVLLWVLFLQLPNRILLFSGIRVIEKLKRDACVEIKMNVTATTGRQNCLWEDIPSFLQLYDSLTVQYRDLLHGNYEHKSCSSLTGRYVFWLWKLSFIDVFIIVLFSMSLGFLRWKISHKIKRVRRSCATYLIAMFNGHFF